MDAASALEVITQLFFTDRRTAMEKLSDLVEGATGKRRAPAMREIVKRVDHEHPGLAAYLALAGGALVEDGEEAGALGRALVAPLVRSLTAAARMLDHVAHLPDAELDEEDDEGDGVHDREHDHEHDGHGHDHVEHHHDHEDDDARVLIGRKAVDRATLDGIADKDLPAVQAWFSMDVWYRPAVATWTRDPAVLREVQRNAELRAALARLGDTTETSHWLSLLVETLFDARLVLVFPETGEAWQLTANGIVDVGQLSTLLAPALREPLARIGITDMPEEDVIAVMRGDGPQELDAAYSCAFHCYPVEASERTNSLPPDFLPGTLEPIEGARVLVVVGPRSPGAGFVRAIPAVRTFDGLEAGVSAVAQLPADEARRWGDLAKSRGA